MIFMSSCVQKKNKNESANVKIVDSDTSTIVSEIDKKVLLIERDSTNFDTSLSEFISPISSEGADLLRYTLEGELRKAIVSFYGTMTKFKFKYFFENERVIFIQVRSYFYNKPFYMENSEIDRIENEVIYVVNNSIFMWLNDEGHIIRADSMEIMKMERDIVGFDFSETVKH